MSSQSWEYYFRRPICCSVCNCLVQASSRICLDHQISYSFQKSFCEKVFSAWKASQKCPLPSLCTSRLFPQIFLSLSLQCFEILPVWSNGEPTHVLFWGWHCTPPLPDILQIGTRLRWGSVACTLAHFCWVCILLSVVEPCKTLVLVLGCVCFWRWPRQWLLCGVFGPSFQRLVVFGFEGCRRWEQEWSFLLWGGGRHSWVWGRVWQVEERGWGCCGGNGQERRIWSLPRGSFCWWPGRGHLLKGRVRFPFMPYFRLVYNGITSTYMKGWSVLINF